MRSLAVAGISIATLLAAMALRAHDGGTTGYAAITIDRNMVRYQLTLSSVPASPLATQMQVGQAGAAPRYQLLADAIATQLKLRNNGEACQAGPRRFVAPTQTVVSVSAAVDFVCAGEIAELAIRDDLFDVLGNELHTLAKIEWSQGDQRRSQQFAFGPDQRETVVAVSSAAEENQALTSQSARGAFSFFPLGVEHILLGYDHLLFLLALIVCGGTALALLKLITAFTIAHSVTLALAALDVVTFASHWVEALIALSIAYVAAENLLPRFALSRRWIVSFIFGAVHGFGFATILRETALEKTNLLWSLLNFNLGVEIGQAVVVLVLLPLLIVMHKRSWGRIVSKAISIVVLLIGFGLLVARVLL